VLDLNTVVRDTDRILRRLIGEDIDLEMVLEPELDRISADPGQIEQILMNLAVNSRDAMPVGGKLTIETSNKVLGEDYARTHPPIQPGRYVMLAVSDTGHGMDAETQSHIFEPFFTTKERGKGTGLGLSTVYGIVEQSGGFVWVYSEPAHGTTFKIYLPRIDTMAETLTPRAPQKVAKRRGSETVLVAEDDKEVRRMMCSWFHANGYTVLEAADGQEALEIFENDPGPIHLVVTDLVMPRMGGLELSKNLSRLGKQMKVLFLSGYSDQAVIQHGILDKGAPFLQKPFGLDALAAKVAELLNSL
jgi:CheY-like chemotaxis protein